MLRKSALWMCLIVVGVILLELCSYLTLAWAETHRQKYFAVPEGQYELLLSSIDQAQVDQFRVAGYDATLGWINRPGSRRDEINAVGVAWSASYDSAGARTNPRFPNRILIASYGDSFTHGDEVNDDETWPFYLSRRVGANVQNFGVGGFGPDQALLRLEGHLAARRAAPYVILGIFEENINRLLSAYRPFYLRQSRLKIGFKPRFSMSGDRLTLIPNPLAKLDDLTDVRSAFAKAREVDGWYQHNREKITSRFPYFPTLVDVTLTALDREGLVEHPFREVTASRYGLAWRDPEARQILHALIERFAARALEYRFRPIVLFIPFVTLRDAPRTPGYRSFLESLRGHPSLGNLILIDFSEARFERTRFRLAPRRGHASAYGNDAISRHVHGVLCRRKGAVLPSASC